MDNPRPSDPHDYKGLRNYILIEIASTIFLFYIITKSETENYYNKLNSKYKNWKNKRTLKRLGLKKI